MSLSGETRLLRSIRAIVRALTAHTDYFTSVRYRVVENAPGGRVTLQAIRKGPWPDTLPLSFVSGTPGAKGTPALGSTVIVQFLEGDPSLPVVTHGERPEAPGFVPLSSSLDASGTVTIGASSELVELGSGSESPPPVNPTGRVLRYGDTISTPGGDLIIAPGTVPAPVAKVKA
ncbi:MAG: hypothetical protein AMXMBFR56_29350 [Polyangiaceae bacterium]